LKPLENPEEKPSPVAVTVGAKEVILKAKVVGVTS